MKSVNELEAWFERKSGPARGLWIEIEYCGDQHDYEWSGPARGLWIEIAESADAAKAWAVGPREGPVD